MVCAYLICACLSASVFAVEEERSHTDELTGTLSLPSTSPFVLPSISRPFLCKAQASGKRKPAKMLTLHGGFS